MTDTSEQIENNVRAALAADVQSQFGQDLTVVDYQAVVTVMDDEGKLSLRRLLSGDPTLATQLGPARWAVKGIEYEMDMEFAEEWADES